MSNKSYKAERNIATGKVHVSVQGTGGTWMSLASIEASDPIKSLTIADGGNFTSVPITWTSSSTTITFPPGAWSTPTADMMYGLTKTSAPAPTVEESAAEIRTKRKDETLEALTATERADLADAAADVLEADGWTQGRYHSGATGEHCAVGALQKAGFQFGIGAEQGLYGRVDNHITGLSYLIADMLGCQHLQSWNDVTGRTADDVITALRDYAIKVRPDLVEMPAP